MKVAIVGATGLVGTRMIQVLEERQFPVDEFIPVASERSVGKTVVFRGQPYTVVSADEAIARRPALAIFSAGAAASREASPPPAAAWSTIPPAGGWTPTKSLSFPKSTPTS